MDLFTFSKQNSKHSSKLSPTKRCVLVGGSTKDQRSAQAPNQPTMKMPQSLAEIGSSWRDSKKCHRVSPLLIPETSCNHTWKLKTKTNWNSKVTGKQKRMESKSYQLQRLVISWGGTFGGGGAGMAQEFSFGSHQLVHCFPKIIKKDIQNQNILLVLQSLPPNRPERKYKYITYLAPLKQTGKYLGFKD